MAIESINPTTEELVERFDEYSSETIEKKLEQSEKTWRAWRKTDYASRAKHLERASAYLKDHKRRLGEMITGEMGKPIGQAIAEVEKCALGCDYYAEHAERLLAPRMIATDAERSYVRYDPIGPILAVMPWNFPLWQVFRFAAPTLMAGNVAVLKHASNVPLCALEIEKIFAEAGFPSGAFTTLLIGAGKTEGVIRDRRIRAVTLTGSEAAGRKVASTAGDSLKKTVLELGGSDPYIILDDANIDEAAKVGAFSRNINSGQTCISAKRFIVVESVADQFADRFAYHLGRLKVGDPIDETTDIGPLARPDLRDDLHEQVVRSCKSGAKLFMGGEIPEGKGYFYPVTLLTDVREGMAAADEETFGPAAAMLTVKDAEAAIALANAVDYGLGATLWTADLDRAADLVAGIEAGCVFVNGLVKSDPRLPFGGIKNSGYGRELSEEGIREFVNVKTVWMAK